MCAYTLQFAANSQVRLDIRLPVWAPYKSGCAPTSALTAPAMSKITASLSMADPAEAPRIIKSYPIKQDSLNRFDILEDCLLGTTSMESAASKLAYITLDGPVLLFPRNLSHLWRCIICLACVAPHNHEKLVRLLTHLTQPLDVRTKQGQSSFADGLPLWKDTPLTSTVLFDTWNEQGIYDGVDGVQHWINLNLFIANILSKIGPKSRLSAFALATLRDALEYPDSSGDFIIAAAGYIEFLGTQMYTSPAEFNSTWADPYAPTWARGAGPLWYGAHGFSRARCVFWRSRFEMLGCCETEPVAPEVKEAAVYAGWAMKSIERRVRNDEQGIRN